MNRPEVYIDFGIAQYAIVDILLMLENAGIKDYFITQEDWDLHIRIPKSHLESIYNRVHNITVSDTVTNSINNCTTNKLDN